GPVPNGGPWSTKIGDFTRPQERTASSTSEPFATTTTVFEGRSFEAARRTCHRIGRPQTGWRTFGVADFRRLPRPAARTTTAREEEDFFGTGRRPGSVSRSFVPARAAGGNRWRARPGR